MTSPISAAADAVVVRLAAALAPVPVYAHPPANMAMPSVTLDRELDQPEDPIADKISRVTLTFTMWSAKRGPQELRRVRDLMYASLHDQTFDLDAGGVVMCRWARSDITRDADGVTYVGSVLIEIVVDHES